MQFDKVHAAITDRHRSDYTAKSLVLIPNLGIKTKLFSLLSDFKMEYETIACEVESIAESLQKYSKYGSFSTPDFSATRLAYTDICGDGADEEGHINHCLTLLDAYDAEATELILDRGIDKKIAQLQWQLESHFGVAMPGTDYSTMFDVENRIRYGEKVTLVDTSFSANRVDEIFSKEEWSYSDLQYLRYWYDTSMKTGDKRCIGLIRGISDYDEICADDILWNLVTEADNYYSNECKFFLVHYDYT